MKTPEEIMNDFDGQVVDQNDYENFTENLGPLEHAYVVLSNYMRNMGFTIEGWHIYAPTGDHWGDVITMTGLSKEGEEVPDFVGVHAVLCVSPGEEGEHFVNISITDRPAMPKGHEEFAMPTSWSLKS